MAAPCILFFDEIDAIAGRRGGQDGATVERMVAQLLTEMDGISELAGVVVLGATNRIDRIDPALLRPGRFDTVVEVPQPDRSARIAMLRVHTSRMRIAPDTDMDAIADAIDGSVGADIAGLCRMAALAALARNGSASDATSLVVRNSDFSLALRQHREGRSWQTL